MREQLAQQTDQAAAEVWPGLRKWRTELNRGRRWGAKGPEPTPVAAVALPPPSLAAWGRLVLLTADPLEKAALTHAAFEALAAGGLELGAAPPVDAPARPTLPKLVPPRQIPTMKASPLPLNIYQLHNLAHVELNAIDLAWDTVVRFAPLQLPAAFYEDFARLADDEARHLEWCLQRMGELGYAYGCMPAHNLLWEGAAASAHDLGARLAIVPMSQEARGLDAGQRLAQRLVGWGDNRTAAIVAQIADEEKAHVAVGVAWFRWLCAALGADPGPQFRALLLALCPDLIKGPFNDAGRQEVGLERGWYDVGLWPEGQRQAAAAALEDAKRRSKQAAAAEQEPAPPPPQQQQQQEPEQGCEGPSSTGAGAADGRASMLPPASDPQQLQQLRQRLEHLLAVELRASGS